MKSFVTLATVSAIAAMAWAAPAGAQQGSSASLGLDPGMIPEPQILMPDGAPTSLVFLLSDKPGWGDTDKKEADRLRDNGSIVVGIDTPKYIAALSASSGDCIYTVSDIERVSHQLQRAAASNTFLQPVVAGRGEGGALALAILAQTPKATIGQTLAFDPVAGIPLQKQLCTPANSTPQGDRMVYDLTDGDLPDPLTVVFTTAAPRDGRDHVARLVTAHPDIDVHDSRDAAAKAFSDTLDELVAAESQGDQPLGLPLTVLDAEPRRDTMAVVLSGDGGWRDLDRQVAEHLRADGVPVVGLDSLRYFWSVRTPQQTADDLARIIRAYTKRWNVEHVLLVGYSFGADVLPASYNLLPENLQARVSQVSLLALSHQVDYEISVSGWLGVTSGRGAGNPVDDINAMNTSIVQCFYGAAEEEDACRDLEKSNAEIVELPGGHHFDGDYEALTRRILDGLDNRLGG